MSSAKYREVMSNATVAGPASEVMIKAAEDYLSLRFPTEYRRFLKEFGALMGTGFEIAGIFADEGPRPPLWRDVVKDTERFRKSANGMLPDTLVPISDDGGDVSYYIDAANQDEVGCEVVAYGPGFDGKTVARNLEEFIVRLAKGDLDV